MCLSLWFHGLHRLMFLRPAGVLQLLQPGELLPGVASSEFESRRRQLLELLPAGAVAVIPAAPVVHMAGVIPYPYRPDADFLYLTGITQVAWGVCGEWKGE